MSQPARFAGSPPRLRQRGVGGLGTALALAASLLLLPGCVSAMQEAHEAPDEPPASPIATATAAPTPPPPASPRPSPSPTLVRESVFPLPGGLDATPVFNSDNPEIVEQPGILLTTLAPRNPEDASSCLDYAFSGRFDVFSHHIVREAPPGDRLLYLGLVATNPTGSPIAVSVESGATALTQPDSPFIDLPRLVIDPEGDAHSGPGDRISTDLIHGRSPFPRARLTVAPGRQALLYGLPLPTNVLGETPTNGRSTLLHLESDGPVRLSEVALHAVKARDGSFRVPTLADYAAALDRRVLAGRREVSASYYDPTGRGAPGFRYGRVGGVTQGSVWHAAIFPKGTPAMAPGERVGFPIATVHLNRLGTPQVQSAPMLRRYPDAARAGHGNYGVTYEIAIRLDNPDAASRSYDLSLSHPAKVELAPAGGEGRISGASRVVTYLTPPSVPASFRGTLRAEWPDATGAMRTRYVHLVLHAGEDSPPFAEVAVPPGETRQVTVHLSYPADATPPQLLTVTRR